jgi:hypothetical protein
MNIAEPSSISIIQLSDGVLYGALSSTVEWMTACVDRRSGPRIMAASKTAAPPRSRAYL